MDTRALVKQVRADAYYLLYILRKGQRDEVRPNSNDSCCNLGNSHYWVTDEMCVGCAVFCGQDQIDS